jgi:hypothetical protein
VRKRKLTVAVLVAALVGAAMLLMSMAQNDGCLPWQESVGIQGSPFSGTEDVRTCR